MDRRSDPPREADEQEAMIPTREEAREGAKRAIAAAGAAARLESETSLDDLIAEEIGRASCRERV